jgi:hypothetical protein
MRERQLKQDSSRPRVGPKGGMVVQKVRVGQTTYVQTYIRCGPRCARCRIGGRAWDPDRPGHGPYWYAWIPREGKPPIRRYCGADLEVFLATRGTVAAQAAVPEAGESSEAEVSA